MSLAHLFVNATTSPSLQSSWPPCSPARDPSCPQSPPSTTISSTASAAKDFLPPYSPISIAIQGCWSWHPGLHWPPTSSPANRLWTLGPTPSTWQAPARASNRPACTSLAPSSALYCAPTAYCALTALPLDFKIFGSSPSGTRRNL